MTRIYLLFYLMMFIFVPASAAQDEADFAAVLVAARDLPRGLLLTEDLVLGENAAVKIAFYPADGVPATAVQNPGELIGNVLRTDVPAENPIVQHYLFPHPVQRPLSDIPFPISPPGYRVARTYGTYFEFTLDNLDQVRFSPLLAAGDSVDIITTTGAGSILQDETSILVEAAVIALVSEDVITLSVTSEQQAALETWVSTGLPITLVMRAYGDQESPLEPFNNGSNRVDWDYLINRLDNPLVIPDGADIGALGGR